MVNGCMSARASLKTATAEARKSGTACFLASQKGSALKKRIECDHAERARNAELRAMSFVKLECKTAAVEHVDDENADPLNEGIPAFQEYPQTSLPNQ